MTPSDDAILKILKTIAEAGDWIDLWNIRINSGYSTEYTRQAVKLLYWEREALQRMRKGAKFLYRTSVKAARIITEMEKT